MLRGLCSFSDRYRILHLTWLAFFLSFVVWFNFAPFATTIQKDLNLSPAQIKTLAICNLALTIPARIIIGMILDRFGPRLTFSCLLVFAAFPCLGTAIAFDFNELVWSSLATGIMGAGFVVGVRMVAEWFPPKEIGIAQGIYGGWGNFGAAAAGFVLPSIGVATSIFAGGMVNWRLAIFLTGVICAGYGVIYYFSVSDTPPGQVYLRPKRHGGTEVTSAKSFWAMIALDLGMLLSLGLLTWPLAQPKIHFLSTNQVILIWVILASLYAFQTYKSWQVNREVVGSLNPLSANFLRSTKLFAPKERYEFRQVALLDFTYFTHFGSQLAAFSMLPAFFEHTFGLNQVMAGMIAALSYPCLNLVSRPSGGLMSDQLGSRKWTMTGLTFGIGIGYLLMSAINSSWILSGAIAVTMLCAYCVQAGAGATFGLVPLIKREITGQLAGSVGAYGNVGGVVYLTIYSLTDARTLFLSMGMTAVVCAILCGIFLKEPQESFAAKVEEVSILATVEAANTKWNILLEFAKTDVFEAVLKIILQQICQTADWKYGEVWLPDGKVLRCHSAHYLANPRLAAFRRESECFTFVAGAGLPGRVWTRHEPEWIENVSSASPTIYYRAQIARKAGLKAALAAPIFVRGEVLGVLVFYSDRTQPSNESLLSAYRTQIQSLMSQYGFSRAI